MLVLCYHLYLLFGDILISQLYAIMMLNIRNQVLCLSVFPKRDTCMNQRENRSVPP
jgi:hypothetical protein